MGSYNHTRAFHPLDLEIMDRVYEAAWAALQARDPFRDPDRRAPGVTTQVGVQQHGHGQD